MKHKAAFTKTDTLVVIACLAFLFAGLAAVGPAGRSRAQQAACLSKLMKWGQVLQIYTAANNGLFHTREIGTAAGYSQMWLWTYEPYYSDRSMLCCPAADNPYRDYDTFSTWGGPNWQYSQFGSWDPDAPEYCGPNPPYYGSYGWNRFITDMSGFSQGDPTYWRRVVTQGADNIPILVDCIYVSLFWVDNSPPPEYEGDIYTSGIGLATINRHDGGVNVLFMDFSARKVGLKELWTLKGNRYFDTCNEYTICGHGGNAASCAAFWDSQAPWMSEFPEY